jgi:PPOX class probable F420-dependent enzyme
MQKTTLEDPRAQGFLAGIEVGVLATINPDGTPLVTPMWFAPDESTIGMVSVDGVRKVANMRHDPRASFVAETGTGMGIQCVIAEGRIEFVSARDEQLELVDRLHRKYEHLVTRWGQRALPPNRILFRLRPSRVKLWNF